MKLKTEKKYFQEMFDGFLKIKICGKCRKAKKREKSFFTSYRYNSEHRIRFFS